MIEVNEWKLIKGKMKRPSESFWLTGNNNFTDLKDDVVAKMSTKCILAEHDDIFMANCYRLGFPVCKQHFNSIHSCDVNSDCSVDAVCFESDSPNEKAGEEDRSGICECKSGFYGDGSSCKDINECTTNLHTCPDDKNCANTHGGYNCTLV